MKKKLLICMVLIIVILLTFIFINQYKHKRIEACISFISRSLELIEWKKKDSEVEVYKVINANFKELNMLIIIDENTIYVNAERWLLPNSHYKIEINFFDKQKGFVIYE